VADGNAALYYNLSGYGNTADGSGALYLNSNGVENTADGAGALSSNIIGSCNTAVGASALASGSAGSFITAVGYASGSTQSGGTKDTFIGYGAGTPATANLSNATAIGALATVSKDNTLVLGGTGASSVTVAIGTASPYTDYALDVEDTLSHGIDSGEVVNANGGNIYLGMTNGAHMFRVGTDGTVYADGGFNASGADFAESVAVRGGRAQYQPGDVLEIDPGADRHLALARHAYSTLVAGIYSTKPGVLASAHHIDDPAIGGSEVPLAVVGIVPCKVTAGNGPIARGDLLVASDRSGYAMKGTDRSRLVGAVVGKAMEPLPSGTGVIQVLVTVQ
jgi:hypothetical protein